jgi:hypothetical protein
MTAIARRHRARLCLILLLTLNACASKGPWRQLDDATPWIAPGTRALLFIRSVEGFGVTAERAWRDASGRNHFVNGIQDDIEEFLHKTGLMAQWPDSHSGNEFGTERLAPFRFTVVTVNPTVVLMTPFDFGSPTGKSESGVLAPIGDKGCLGNHHMINPLECDIVALYAPEMQWFSHDLERSPAPIVWKDGRAEIGLGNGERLTLTQDDATVHTERTSTTK